MSPSATFKEFHFTGKSRLAIVPIASRCSLVVALSKVTTAQSIWPLEKSPPRSPAIQNLAPSSLVAPKLPLLTL